ncbi:hypothetical protein G6N05_07625 [Flavobacterium sp. F372]|uniref:Mercuric transport protein MerT n=1 Tax=Flavobacterium bernardetii TaxID=2813823 RepID=A0ABR7IX79_9FLAO|nr:hypothetical protein [Flavobacterium bernardetii]MBC5834386.1 hypothetical protein [Flavobacterium bernardetii]NHF69975.1 hypothetical protein [Flavobacterium bernardetii]
MNKIKSIWTTITGSVSAAIPLFFAVCKSGACTAVCVSPIASIFGISSASLTASPLMKSLFPLLLVISAVAFTISYYKLYVLPKYASATSCETDCGCDTLQKPLHKTFPFWSFWVGLVASIVFFTYFEVQNYNSETQKVTTPTEVNVVKLDNAEAPCCADTKKCE